MDPILLSRWQFGLTTIFHFFFVPLTIGMVVLVAIMETMYVRTGKEVYKQMTKFWGKLFLINFAAGVVSGIVLEFQFGMNWSIYSRFVGDVVGVPLALDALLAFFLESTFLGVWIFGWDVLPKRVHLAAIWMVALGANLSGAAILLANGWMQQPVGYELNPTTGLAVLNDFWAMIANPRGWYLIWHTVSSSLTTAGFFILGISVYHLFRKNKVDFFQRSFRIGAIVGLSAAIMTGVSGHAQGVHLLDVQPMTAAASEAHFETADPAPFKVIAGFDSTGKEEVWSWEIPKALSWLYFFQPEGEVVGIDDIQEEYVELYGPGDYIPNVAVSFWSFRIMVGIGFLLVGLGAVAVWVDRKEYPEKSLKWLRWLVWAIPLPYLANTFGWILTEVGRQPWVVQGLLLTSDAVSPNVPASSVWTSMALFGLIYSVILGITIALIMKYAKAGPASIESKKSIDQESSAAAAA